MTDPKMIDTFHPNNGHLAKMLIELRADSVKFGNFVSRQLGKVIVIGTARSRPGPNMNGYLDYAWSEELGACLQALGMSVGTGGGPGGMEAPHRGHRRMEALQQSRSTYRHRKIAPPVRQGANILLPKEQGTNPFLARRNYATFARYLFRKEALFSNTTALITTPGGFGTLDELFSFMALKGQGEVKDPIALGARDDFFVQLRRAFLPLLTPSEREDLQHDFNDPVRLAVWIKAHQGVANERPVREIQKRAIADLTRGLMRLDGMESAVCFVGGEGDQSRTAAPIAKAIACALADAGIPMRVAGSSIIDSAAVAGVHQSKKSAKIQGFALEGTEIIDRDDLHYDRVQDPLVLQQLAMANARGLVVTPDGARQLAQIYSAATEIQTHKLARIPIVVLDVNGTFAKAHKVMGELMTSEHRKYIDAQDLNIITVTSDPAEAVRILKAHVPPSNVDVPGAETAGTTNASPSEAQLGFSSDPRVRVRL